MPLSLDTAAHCTPATPADRLDPAKAAAWLANFCPAWETSEGGRAITRTFRFPDYYRTMAFVNALAHIAHREDHHPDLSVHYDRVVVRFSTHDAGGITRNDLLCAAKTDALME